jgi:hypothetical protein
MRDDQLKAFDVFLREWCEQRGWPYQPDELMTTKDYWADVEGTDEFELAQFNRAIDEEK